MNDWHEYLDRIAREGAAAEEQRLDEQAQVEWSTSMATTFALMRAIGGVIHNERMTPRDCHRVAIQALRLAEEIRRDGARGRDAFRVMMPSDWRVFHRTYWQYLNDDGEDDDDPDPDPDPDFGPKPGETIVISDPPHRTLTETVPTPEEAQREDEVAQLALSDRRAIVATIREMAEER